MIPIKKTMLSLGFFMLFMSIWDSACGQDFKIKTKGRPFINNYTKTHFGRYMSSHAGVHGADGIIYTATVRGFSQFDGVNWRLLNVESVGEAFVDIESDSSGVIYAMTRSHLGYLQPGPIGELVYTSLMSEIPDKFDEIGTFASIDLVGNFLIVKASSTLLVISTKNRKIDVVRGQHVFKGAFVDGDIFYVFDEKGQLFQFSEGVFRKLSDPKGVTDVPVSRAIVDNKGRVLILNESKELFTGDFNSLSQWQTDIDDFLADKLVTGMLNIDGYIVFSTLTAGIVIIDENGQLIQKLDVTTGLNGRDIHSLFLDHDQNLWAAQQGAVSQIILNSPFTLFAKEQGMNSFANDMARIGSKMYLGLDDGVYYKDDTDPWQSLGDHKVFKKIEGYDGHVRAFQVADGKLFAGGKAGLLLIEGAKASWLHRKEGLLHGRVAIRGKDMVIFGGSSGSLHLIAKESGVWKYKWEIKGFKGPVDSIWEVDGGLWVIDSGVGVNKLMLNAQYDSVLNTKYYGVEEGFPSIVNIRAYGHKEGLAFLTQDGIYAYDSEKDRFYPDGTFSNVLRGIRPIRFTELADENIMTWTEEDNVYRYYYLRKTAETYVREAAPHQFLADLTSNVINSFDSKEAWIGGPQMAHFDPDFHWTGTQGAKAYIREVRITNTGDSLIFAGHSNDNVPVLRSAENAIRFHFGASFYEQPDKILFQSYLEGNETNWSEWSPEAFHYYTNLPHGSYTLRVRAKNAYQQLSEEDSFTFVIDTPWYSTPWAYLVYVSLGVLLIRMLLVLNGNRLRRKNEELEKIIEQRTYKLSQQAEEIQKQKEEAEKTTATIAERNERIETLFKEVHHRVKNNLQLISSLLNMQQEWSTTQDTAKVIEDSRSRVVAMSVIHQFLYRTEDISAIDFRQYAEELIIKLDSIQLVKVKYRLNINFDDDYIFDIDTSISLGLILNELATNSYKHRATSHQEVQINLEMKKQEEDGYYQMIYSDNGKAIEEPFEELLKKGFGLRLASRLSKQLHGNFKYEFRSGNHFSVTFAEEKTRQAEADA